MRQSLWLCLVSLLLLQYVTGQDLLDRQERRARRKQKVLKAVAGCQWERGECTPKRGRCGKGFQTATLTGAGCPEKTKRVRCHIPCREEAQGPITGLSPSEAGLKAESAGTSVTTVSKKRKNNKKRRLCRYTKLDWSPCDPATNQMKRTLTLKKGDTNTCPQTKEIVRKCKKACKYEKGDWSSCDPTTMTKTRTLRLKKGDPGACEASKVVSRRCKNGGNGSKGKKKKNKVGKAKGCKYTRGDWTECDQATNMRSRTLTLRKGNPNRCQPTITVNRKCKKPCKYTRGDWSECNPVTSVRYRTLTLRKGDPGTCEATKILRRKCKKPCRYNRGQWSECDETTLLKTRTDTLKTDNSASTCDQTRTVTKPCKVKDKQKCEYDIKPWSECNPITKERTREKTLIQGGPQCETTKTIRRSCQKNNGEERCFFGPWGEFEECRNGVKKKMRAVLSGPTTCQRKAVKTRACKVRN